MGFPQNEPNPSLKNSFVSNFSFFFSTGRLLSARGDFRSSLLETRRLSDATTMKMSRKHQNRWSLFLVTSKKDERKVSEWRQWDKEGKTC